MTGKIPQRLQYTVQGHLLHEDVWKGQNEIYIYSVLAECKRKHYLSIGVILEFSILSVILSIFSSWF